jgi:hypothetical protein
MSLRNVGAHLPDYTVSKHGCESLEYYQKHFIAQKGLKINCVKYAYSIGLSVSLADARRTD